MGKLYKLACPLTFATKIIDELSDAFAENNRRIVTVSTTLWTPADVTYQNRILVPSDENLQANYDLAFQRKRNDNLAKVADQFFARVDVKEGASLGLSTTIFDKTLLEAVLAGKQLTLPVHREYYFSSFYHQWPKQLYDRWIGHRDEGLADAQTNLEDLHRQGQSPRC